MSPRLTMILFCCADTNLHGHQPIVSEYLDVDGLPERALYSPYRHESYNDIIYSTKFSKSDKVHIKERYAFDQCPDARRNYIYYDTNGDGFFDSLRISLDDKTLGSWDFSLQDKEIHVVPQ